MSEKSKYWDEVVKPLAREVIEKATVDKELIEFYVSRMIFACEHDLADGRFPGLMSLNCMIQVEGNLKDESYFKNIHPNTPKEEIERMKRLSKEINNLMDKKGD